MHGYPTLARRYIGGMTGASRAQIETRVSSREAGLGGQRSRAMPSEHTVTGRIAGRPWRTAIDFNEARPLIRHLGTAAFIVCAYLTGMRPGEILGLRTGCCPDPVPLADGRPGRHLIRGLVFKTATDEDGNHQSGGAERGVPWVAITPVVNAIRVLEQMVPDGHLLFDHEVHDPVSHRPGTGSLKTSSLRERIEDFTAWANQEASLHGLANEMIPADPRGKIGLRRFRRFLSALFPCRDSRRRRQADLRSVQFDYLFLAAAYHGTT
jgi:integrase